MNISSEATNIMAIIAQMERDYQARITSMGAAEKRSIEKMINDLRQAWLYNVLGNRSYQSCRV